MSNHLSASLKHDKVKAVFSKDPEITIYEGRAHIHFVISGPLTYILEENCVKDTTICDTSNITVPTKHYLKTISTNMDTHNFSADVPLADSEATQFVFSFWMYDGEDLLSANTVSVNTNAGYMIQLFSSYWCLSFNGFVSG